MPLLEERRKEHLRAEPQPPEQRHRACPSVKRQHRPRDNPHSPSAHMQGQRFLKVPMFRSEPAQKDDRLRNDNEPPDPMTKLPFFGSPLVRVLREPSPTNDTPERHQQSAHADNRPMLRGLNTELIRPVVRRSSRLDLAQHRYHGSGPCLMLKRVRAAADRTRRQYPALGSHGCDSSRPLHEASTGNGAHRPCSDEQTTTP